MIVYKVKSDLYSIRLYDGSEFRVNGNPNMELYNGDLLFYNINEPSMVFNYGHYEDNYILNKVVRGRGDVVDYLSINNPQFIRKSDGLVTGLVAGNKHHGVSLEDITISWVRENRLKELGI